MEKDERAYVFTYDFGWYLVSLNEIGVPEFRSTESGESHTRCVFPRGHIASWIKRQPVNRYIVTSKFQGKAKVDAHRS
jgi:hypothetical protein